MRKTQFFNKSAKFIYLVQICNLPVHLRSHNCTCHVAHCVEYIEHTKCNRLLSTYLLLRIYTQFYQNIVHMRMCVLLRICAQFYQISHSAYE